MTDTPSRLKSLSSSFTVRLFSVGFLALALFITLIPIYDLVAERQERARSAQFEISSKWGGPQTITAPVFSVPYRDPANKYAALQNLFVFPETLDIASQVTPEVRSRGIFDVLLFAAEVQMKGVFPAANRVGAPIAGKGIDWRNAAVHVGIADVKGLAQEVKLRVNGRDIEVQFDTQEVPYTGYNDPLQLSASGVGAAPNENLSFELSMKVRGSKHLQFIPIGRKTKLAMFSSWPTPSFSGAHLPDTRDINDKGFSAQWDISPFGSRLPPYWISEANNRNIFSPNTLSNSAFGAEFFFPADFYQKIIRSVKYGVLFIGFTFLAFFLFEVKNRMRIHPFQYLLIGFALSIFYLLLLSLAEHIGFTAAYIIASIATIGLITSYSMKALTHKKRGLVIGAVLAILYGYLYFLLNESDYALLIGSISLFLALAFVMYVTRNIQWYELEEREGRSSVI